MFQIMLRLKKLLMKITTKNKIDILINNAGITGPTDPLWKYDVRNVE